MKVFFEEAAGIFDCSSIMTDGREWLWYRKAWELLDAAGYTSYETELPRLRILLGAYGLIDMCWDFAGILFGSGIEQQTFTTDALSELWGSTECELHFALGILYAKTKEGAHALEKLPGMDLAVMFHTLVFDERERMAHALAKVSGKGWASQLYIHMYGALLDLDERYKAMRYADEDDEDYGKRMENQHRHQAWRDKHPYEAYLQDVEHYSDDVMNDCGASALEAFGWIADGMHKRQVRNEP